MDYFQNNRNTLPNLIRKRILFSLHNGESYIRVSEETQGTANSLKFDKSVINLFIMGDQISRGEELVKKAEKKLNGWGFFGSKYYDAAHLLHTALFAVNKRKLWDRVGVVYVKLASCHLKIMETTFSGTRECKFLMGLAAAIDKRDVAEFTSCLKEYDSIIKLDEWRTLVLLKVKEALKVKELE
ncbi:hypothetical protein KY285_023678 [Solanum tuberosum]|nr:hypothetical protein KY289_024004 [Solanum tuberosum]KAH0675877.1 hypothetical protein KY285_023678 [Solanum tuberosum]